jgi:hypothetical protein
MHQQSDGFPVEPVVDDAPPGEQMDIADDAVAQEQEMDDGDYKRGKRFKKLYAVLSSQRVRLGFAG